jgi:hypothetical protein
VSAAVRAIALVALAAAAAPACKKNGGQKVDEEGEAKTAEPAETAPPAEEPAAAAVPEAAEGAGAAPAAPPSTPSAGEQATAEKAAAVLDELGKIAEGAKGNCDKAAAAMKGVIGKHRRVLAAAAKLGADEGKEQWLAERYGPRTDAAKSKLMPLMEKCADHEGVATVFDAIE